MDNKEDINILAVGDIMTGGCLSERWFDYKDNLWPSYIDNLFRKADVKFCNFECPLYRLQEPPHDGKMLLYAKEKTIEVIEKAGLNVVSLANNHAMDFGWDSLEETIYLLRKRNIICIGAGKNLEEARKPGIVLVKGKKIGFLAYSCLNIFPKEYQPMADHNKSGVSPYFLEYVEADIRSLRKQVDFIAVSLHWGDEFIYYPSPLQLSQAKQIIDWGADVILGHHPHIIQGYQVYKGKPIFFSLGNFLFSQYHATNGGRLLTYNNDGEFKNNKKVSRVGMVVTINIKSKRFDILPVQQSKNKPVLIEIKKWQMRKYLRKIKRLSLFYNFRFYKFIYFLVKLKFEIFHKKLLKPFNLLETYGVKACFRKYLKRVF